MKRLVAVFGLLSLLLAGPAGAARIGFDDRNAQTSAFLLGSGSEFDELRSLVTGLGHTIVPLTSFDAASLAAANVSALYLSQPYAQGGVEYSASEVTAIQSFVTAGGGLALHADGGAGSEPDGLASMNALASVFGVSFAGGTATEPSGHTILLFNGHPVTAGLPTSPLGGFCVDSQRILSIGSPAIDLTTLGGADDALAAVGTVAGAPGNVVLVSDTSAFNDLNAAGGQDVHIDLCDNRLVATNIANFVIPIPEPGTAALLVLGLAALGVRRSRRAAPAWFACALALGVGAPGPAQAACTAGDARCSEGEFGAPFTDPMLLGLRTPEKCLEDMQGEPRCKPTAGTLVALEDDRFLYWNALEGTEQVEVSLIAEFGFVTTNDQSRVLTIDENHPDKGIWVKPSPEDGGANPDGHEDALGPCDGSAPNSGADGSLFCSDQVVLHDGRVLAAGGTDYYSDNCIDTQFPGGTQNPLPFPPGGAELEGLKNARIFDPADNTWLQTADMEFGRWYPSAVTLPDGDVFIASGVTRLVKPVYPEAPFNSGRNVVQTETFDTSCEQWSNNGGYAEKSLPLFPRMHLLPNGHVYYNAGGQAFNPFGQAYDQSLWNLVSTYDPASKTWTDHAIAGFPLQLSSQGLESIATALNPTHPDGIQQALTDLVGEVANDPAQLAEMFNSQFNALLFTLLGIDPLDPDLAMAVAGGGFRGSTFSVMLMLEPDENGDYSTAEFLTAGGVQSSIVNPSPGGYVATDLSRRDTMDLSGSTPTYSSVVTAPLHLPRWYGSGTLLPNGQLLATSGADRDEVQTPGEEIPVMIAELFDPETDTWTQVDTQNNHRTYHNSAVLMRDGRVLVGGHSPITNSYQSFSTPSATSLNTGRDPSFEIYSPWYVFRDDRPVITSVSTGDLTNGGTFSADVTLGAGASFHSLVLLRRSAHTHVVDADQRGVELPVLSHENGTVTLSVPDANVLPPGKYVLYANNSTADGVVPSKGVSIAVGSTVVSACTP